MLPRLPLLIAALAGAAALPAQQTPPAPATPPAGPEAAATPTPTDAPTPAPASTPTPEPQLAPAATPAPGFRATFTLDTPIADLIADPAARGVLDRDLPGLSTDENLAKFAALGLRRFQPLTGGQLTDAMLVTVARDLAKLSGPAVAPLAPAAAGTSRRNRDASR